MSDSRPINLSASGPPETVLDLEPGDARGRARGRARARRVVAPRRGRGRRGALAALPRRVGPARHARSRRHRGVCVLPRRVSPRARPLAGQRLARQRLRALAVRGEPRVPRARSAASARPRRASARTTKPNAAPTSSCSATRPECPAEGWPATTGASPHGRMTQVLPDDVHLALYVLGDVTSTLTCSTDEDDLVGARGGRDSGRVRRQEHRLGR